LAAEREKKRKREEKRPQGMIPLFQRKIYMYFDMLVIHAGYRLATKAFIAYNRLCVPNGVKND